MRYHGNWVGPGWTAGQYKDVKDLTEADRNVPAVDAFDQAGKDHDIGLFDYPERADELNKKFIEEAAKHGIKGNLAAAAVGLWGPSPSGKKQRPITTREIWERGQSLRNWNGESKMAKGFGNWEDPKVAARAAARKKQLEAERAAEAQAIKDWDEKNAALAGIPGTKRDSEGNPKPGETVANLPDSEDIDFNLPPPGEGFSDDPFGDMSDDIPMIDDGSGGGPEASRAAGPTVGAGSISKETPVLQNATPSRGLQETHTAICCYNGWGSAVLLDHTSPVVLELNLTQPVDILKTAMVNTAEGAAWTKGLNNVPFNGGSTRDSATASAFPITTATGSVVTEAADWFAFWAKIYEYYTVLGCEYEVIIGSVSSGINNDALVGMDFNSYRTAEGSGGNVTPQNAKLTDMMAWKHIQWKRLEAKTSDPNAVSTTVFRGRYKQGMAARNVNNDGDVKTWIKVEELPTLKETIALYFYKHPMNTTKSSTTVCGFNIQFNMKYIVQFKDLREQARYPKTGATAISLVTPTDVTQVL